MLSQAIEMEKLGYNVLFIGLEMEDCKRILDRADS
jgi:hypothetical protein